MIQAFPCTCAGGQPRHSPHSLSLDIRWGHRASDTSLSHGARSAHGNMMLPAAARETLRVGRTDRQADGAADARGPSGRKAGSAGAHGADAEPRRGPGGRPGRRSPRKGRRRPPPVRSPRGAGRRPGPPLPAPWPRPARSAPSAARALLVSGCQAAAARARRRWACGSAMPAISA